MNNKSIISLISFFLVAMFFVAPLIADLPGPNEMVLATGGGDNESATPRFDRRAYEKRSMDDCLAFFSKKTCERTLKSKQRPSKDRRKG
jgi:hypothetical protein